MRWIFFTVLFVAAGGPAGSQEFSFLTGPIEDMSTHDHSSGWQLEFATGAAEHLKYSLSYINEGHATTDHRDGIAGQIWARASALDPQLVLAVGAGPYFYFNTRSAGSNPANEHGWGGIASVEAIWYTKTRWFFQVRTNLIETRGPDTLSASFGIGYRFGQAISAQRAEAPPPKKTTNNEITLFLGDTIVNNPDRGHYSGAVSIEYRRGLSQHLDWTVGWLHENKNRLIERSGVMTQVWAVNAYFNDRLTLGAGIGPYLAEDAVRNPRHTGKIFASGVVSLTTSYRFLSLCDARFSWSRIITDYDRDSDLLMLGIGYLF